MRRPWSQVLGCGIQGHEAAVLRLQGERKQLAKSSKALLEELATAAGRALVASLPAEVKFRLSGHMTNTCPRLCCSGEH